MIKTTIIDLSNLYMQPTDTIKLLDGISLAYLGQFKKEVLKFFDWDFAPLTDGTKSNEIILVYQKNKNTKIDFEQIKQYQIKEKQENE